MIWFYLLGGLFLGWSLGANDAANLFGTAVGTRMISFRRAALVASVFVILGAVIGGAGPVDTLGKLGAVNALAGSFTVATAAGATVTWMTRLKMPVSTSQSIVGAIIGWNLFTGSPTDIATLTQIVLTWVLCPVIAGAFSYGFYYAFKKTLWNLKVHMLRQDLFNRLGLLFIGAFGAYSLGASNIANVMGVFVPAAPLSGFSLPGMQVSGAQQLFLIGGIAIAVGIFTYSHRVMHTVGSDLFKLNPVTALIVVLAQSMVLFLFASRGLQAALMDLGLPAIPLVPVSSSQAVIGAILGIGLAKGVREVHYGVLGKIALGWLMTPVLAAVLGLCALFVMQNVFELTVAAP